MTSQRVSVWLQLGTAACVIALMAVAAQPFRPVEINTGDRAPGFRLRTDSGLEVSAQSFGGKVLVLNFWASWCPPCRQEMPSLDGLQRQFPGREVVVVAISIDENEIQYKKYLTAHPVSFTTVREPKMDVSSRYGTFAYPETFLIVDGTVREKVVGPQNWTDPAVVQRLRSLL